MHGPCVGQGLERKKGVPKETSTALEGGSRRKSAADRDNGESGTSQSKSGTSVNSSYSGKHQMAGHRVHCRRLYHIKESKIDVITK